MRDSGGIVLDLVWNAPFPKQEIDQLRLGQHLPLLVDVGVLCNCCTVAAIFVVVIITRATLQPVGVYNMVPLISETRDLGSSVPPPKN